MYSRCIDTLFHGNAVSTFGGFCCDNEAIGQDKTHPTTYSSVQYMNSSLSGRNIIIRGTLFMNAPEQLNTWNDCKIPNIEQSQQVPLVGISIDKVTKENLFFVNIYSMPSSI
ncbi:hypothetical protein CBL_07272 [Carabus blaptoides fortunei]